MLHVHVRLLWPTVREELQPRMHGLIPFRYNCRWSSNKILVVALCCNTLSRKYEQYLAYRASPIEKNGIFLWLQHPPHGSTRVVHSQYVLILSSWPHGVILESWESSNDHVLWRFSAFLPGPSSSPSTPGIQSGQPKLAVEDKAWHAMFSAFAAHSARDKDMADSDSAMPHMSDDGLTARHATSPNLRICLPLQLLLRKRTPLATHPLLFLRPRLP